MGEVAEQELIERRARDELAAYRAQLRKLPRKRKDDDDGPRSPTF